MGTPGREYSTNSLRLLVKAQGMPLTKSSTSEGLIFRICNVTQLAWGVLPGLTF